MSKPTNPANTQPAPTAHGGRVCPWWIAPSFDNPLRRFFQDPYRILAGLVHPGQTAVDLGCGMGYFSIPLATLIGPAGKVICVDLQPEMLDGVRRRAERGGVLAQIRLLRCTPERIGLEEPVDFALAFWMLHEVPDQEAFLREVCAALRPGGRLLVVEPWLHVSDKAFARSVELACAAGLTIVARPKITISNAALLAK
jgi:ubiquinone/menaquinone biosynthesis C-methylase UbiE